MTPDIVVFGEDVFTGKRVRSLQIWADQKRPEAWRGAIDWIKRVIGEQEAVAVIRFGKDAAVTLVPPRLSDTGEWVEIDSRIMSSAHGAAVKRLQIEEHIKRAAEVLNNSEESDEVQAGGDMAMPEVRSEDAGQGLQAVADPERRCEPEAPTALREV